MMSKCSFCDHDDGYLCFYCEVYLKDTVKDVIHKFKNEILDTGDWWYAVNTAHDTYDVNVHCLDDDNWREPDAVFSINLYRLDLDLGDTSSYHSKVQYDFDPMTRKEIRLL
jgi:hypothetical protein